ncbi:MAG: four helix bundle protein [Catalinimonas sp.]
MRDLKKLTVWQEAHKVALEVYRATGSFPREEVFGITSQMRRCGVSIPTNIAEGYGRTASGDLIRFCEIAMGAAAEQEYLLLLSHERRYLDATDYQRIREALILTKKRLNVFIQKLKAGVSSTR